jgi:endonuclease YncB( thermonuclease family)
MANQVLLQVSGEIDLGQFWPDGGSDADTTKILVNAKGFQYQLPGMGFQETRVFNGAQVRGKSGTKDAIDKNGRIIVRLEGIDAPELHYQPTSELKDPPKKGKPKPGQKYRTNKQKVEFLKINEKFRQYFGETSTLELSKKLDTYHLNPLPCRVITWVDKPNDVFDCYGRFVGEIIVGDPEISINKWLLEQGWAFPALYNSMSDIDISALIQLSDVARNGGRGIWATSAYTSKIGQLDMQLIYRAPKKNKPPVVGNDIGPVIFPKFFRRLVNWTINRKAGMVKSSYNGYLAGKKNDLAATLKNYLDQGPAADYYTLDKFINNGLFSQSPGGIVVKEASSTLIPQKGVPLSW